MQSRIPVPTDNLAKFCAMFGLLLLVGSMYFFVTLQVSYNEGVEKNYVELQSLLNMEKPTQEQMSRRDLLRSFEVVSRSNKKFYERSIGFFIGIAILLIWYGFRTWIKVIQPQQDKLLKLQIEKQSLEVEILKKKRNQISMFKAK